MKHSVKQGELMDPGRREHHTALVCMCLIARIHVRGTTPKQRQLIPEQLLSAYARFSK
jgi:hypothetical protein